jgi:hypothetical protein
VGDLTAPGLPAGAPQELRDFVECRATTVEIRNGPLTWLDLGLGDDIKASVTIKPGATPGTATIELDPPGLPVLQLPASIKKGVLSIDTSSLPWWAKPIEKKIQAGVKTFVDNLNGFFKQGGYNLAPPTFGDGSITLTKVAVAAPGQAKPPPAVVPVPTPTPATAPVEPPAPAPDPDAGMPPMPPGGYNEPKYVTPPPLPKGELFPPNGKGATTTGGQAGSKQPASGGSVVGGGGPGGPKAPAGLGRLAVLAVIAVLLAGAGVYGFSQLNAVPAGQVGTNPPSASAAAKASPSAAASAATPAPAATATAAAVVPTARPTASPAPTAAGKVFIGGLVFSDRPGLDSCSNGGSQTRNRYTFSVLVALPGQPNPPIEAYSKLLGRKATVVLVGTPDEGTWESSIENVDGRVMIVVDGRACQKTTARSRYGGLTIEGLVLTPGAAGADGAPSSFSADLPA